MHTIFSNQSAKHTMTIFITFDIIYANRINQKRRTTKTLDSQMASDVFFAEGGFPYEYWSKA